jgi:hypothetical protein
MEIFEIKVDRKKATRILFPLSYPIILCNVIYFVVFRDWFLKHLIIAELSIAGIILLLNVDKKERNVYSIVFNDELKTCTLKYYQFFMISFKRTIPYRDLSYSYTTSVYRRGIYPMSLRIKQCNRMVVEIREKYNIGWSNDQITAIRTVIDKINAEK